MATTGLLRQVAAAEAGWNRHNIEVQQAVIVAVDQLLKILAANPGASIDETAAVVLGVANQWRDVVAASAIRAIETSRDVYEMWDLASPVLADRMVWEQARAATGWALWNAETRTYEHSQQSTGRMAGSLVRFVRNGSRETIQQSARLAGTRWARTPGIKACSWCLMLCSRGAVYRTADTAGRAKDFHDHCDCMIVESYTDADLPNIVHDLHAEWQDAAGIANHPNLSPADQLDLWNRHIAETRPLGYSVREVLADGTAVIHPSPAAINVQQAALGEHWKFKANKPWRGTHTEEEVKKLLDYADNHPEFDLPEKTFTADRSVDPTWFASKAVADDVLGSPDRVEYKAGAGYSYYKVLDGPDGRVEVVVQVGRSSGKTPPAEFKVTSVFPKRGAMVKRLDPETGIIGTAPMKEG